jgi:hypothetical protein
MAGVVAALIPTVVSTINSAFQPTVAEARYTGSNATQSVNNLMQAQALLARQAQSMRAGLNRT